MPCLDQASDTEIVANFPTVADGVFELHVLCSDGDCDHDGQLDGVGGVTVIKANWDNRLYSSPATSTATEA